jgi:hypothetical protein
LFAKKSLFFEMFSLLICVGNCARSRCSIAASCHEIGPRRPETAIFPVKFPVSREFAWRRVRIPLPRIFFQGSRKARLLVQISTYLEEVSGAIAEEGGTVDKFVGDGVMAFWNAPVQRPDHALPLRKWSIGWKTIGRFLPPKDTCFSVKLRKRAAHRWSILNTPTFAKSIKA